MLQLNKGGVNGANDRQKKSNLCFDIYLVSCFPLFNLYGIQYCKLR